MTSNLILFGWNRPVPGREQASAAQFKEFVTYLGGLQLSGDITSFDAVFLDPHGGDLNGFFLLRGDAAKLDAVIGSTEWVTHMTRAALHLDGAGVVRGVTGDNLMARMQLWTSLIPS